MAAPVGSMVEKFRDEFDHALQHGVPSANGDTAAAQSEAAAARREADHLSAVAGK